MRSSLVVFSPSIAALTCTQTSRQTVTHRACCTILALALVFAGESASAQMVRIATYNINQAKGDLNPPDLYNLQAVANVISANKIDIVGLQEVAKADGKAVNCEDQEARLGSMLPGMTTFWVQDHYLPPDILICGATTPRRSGNMIMSKFPFLSRKPLLLTEGDGYVDCPSHDYWDEQPRRFQLAEIWAWGKTLRVGNLHLTLAKSKRLNQAQQINNFLIANAGSDHEFVLGDWNNCGATDPAMTIFSGPRHTHYGGTVQGGIDHIFGSAVSTADDLRLMRVWEGPVGEPANPSNHNAKIIQFYLGPTPTSTPTDPDKFFRILAKHSAQSLDVHCCGGVAGDGALVQQYNYLGGANQEWRIKSGPGASRQIVARHSGKCLELPGSSPIPDGTGLVQRQCNGSPSQDWLITFQHQHGFLQYHTIGKPNNRTIDIRGGVHAVESGSRAQIWAFIYPYSDNQLFFFVEVPDVPGSTRPLKRYYAPAAGHHWVTTGSILGGYSFEMTLGHLHKQNQGGQVQLFGCHNKFSFGDRFISIDPACEGHELLQKEGFIFTTGQPGRVQLFRCLAHWGSHFVSTDPNCESQKVEAPLGYALTP